jgi:hypothetical protein
MKKIIHHLRKQPEHVRTHVLHVSTLAAAFILVVLWVYSFGQNLTGPETTTQLKKDLQPLSVLKDNLVGGYQSLSQPASPNSAVIQ